MMRVVDPVTWLPQVDIGTNTPFHVDIPKMRRGGLNVPFFAAYSQGYSSHHRNLSRTLALLYALHWTVKANGSSMALAKSVQDIERLAALGIIAAVPAVEGAYCVRPQDGREILRQLYDLGVRALSLTWNHSNSLGEGVARTYPEGTPSDGGLTGFGREVIEEVNRLGIILDVSHLSKATFWGVLEASRAPIIASHSGISAVRQHDRNLDDDQIRALARAGGAVQVAFARNFLWEPARLATVASIVHHIDHIVRLVGVDHVGIGSDFDGTDVPEDLADASGLPRIAQELTGRGYGKSDIERILGGNTMRILREVEAVAEPSKNLALFFKQCPEMGHVTDQDVPVLSARVDGGIGELHAPSYRVILDGRVLESTCDHGGILYARADTPLTRGQDGFHVLTFEAAISTGEVARETRIIYAR
jgi:membrane dipeptidase